MQLGTSMYHVPDIMHYEAKMVILAWMQHFPNERKSDIAILELQWQINLSQHAQSINQCTSIVQVICGMTFCPGIFRKVITDVWTTITPRVRGNGGCLICENCPLNWANEVQTPQVSESLRSLVYQAKTHRNTICSMPLKIGGTDMPTDEAH